MIISLYALDAFPSNIGWIHQNMLYDVLRGPLWSWSYGSWIYNCMYICNQCLSPLKLWVRILLIARHSQYNII